MAEDVRDPTDEEEELKLEAPKAGVAFRAEMAAMDFLLGYWPVLIGIVAVGLLGVFAYGTYDNWYTDAQRGIAREVARVEADLPVPPGFVALSPLTGTPVGDQELVDAATRLETVSGSGPGRVEALIKAGELYRVAKRPDDARRVLAAASAESSGVLRALAESALASVEIDVGQNDAAVARLAALVQADAGYLSEQAALDLGALHEHLGQKAEANTVYTGFLAKWPESPRAEEVRRRQGGLGAG